MATFLPLPDFSTLAFGGLLEKNTPLICGGHSNISYETKCYEIGSNEIVAELNTPRCCGASVVINQNTLWVTGGSTKETKQTTEFVRINQPTLPGTQLVKSIHHYFSFCKKVANIEILEIVPLSRKGLVILHSIEVFTIF